MGGGAADLDLQITAGRPAEGEGFASPEEGGHEALQQCRYDCDPQSANNVAIEKRIPAHSDGKSVFGNPTTFSRYCRSTSLSTALTDRFWVEYQM
jgi:hypothetical protein